MCLRPAHAADVPAIDGIVQRAYSVYTERIGRRPTPMDHDYAEKVRDGCVVIAEDHGVVGVIVLVVRPRHVFIENIAVEPTRQRAGIGRALLYHAEEEARRRGLAEVQLYTNAAMIENLALYKRIGYVETEHRTERGFARVYMSKALARST